MGDTHSNYRMRMARLGNLRSTLITHWTLNSLPNGMHLRDGESSTMWERQSSSNWIPRGISGASQGLSLFAEGQVGEDWEQYDLDGEHPKWGCSEHNGWAVNIYTGNHNKSGHVITLVICISQPLFLKATRTQRSKKASLGCNEKDGPDFLMMKEWNQ